MDIINDSYESEENLDINLNKELDESNVNEVDLEKDYLDQIELEGEGELCNEVEELPKKKRSVFGRITDVFLVLLTLTLVGLIVANLFFFQGYSVVGVSMKNTYQDGDKITVCKWKKPDRGDVVVIDRGNKSVIKRVIAFGGEKVTIDVKGKVYINDKPLDEPYLDSEFIRATISEFVCYVPQGHIFYLGDNRKESEDSRTVGTVEESTVKGVVSEYFTKIKDKPIYTKFLYYVFS